MEPLSTLCPEATLAYEPTEERREKRKFRPEKKRIPHQLSRIFLQIRPQLLCPRSKALSLAPMKRQVKFSAKMNTAHHCSLMGLSRFFPVRIFLTESRSCFVSESHVHLRHLQTDICSHEVRYDGCVGRKTLLWGGNEKRGRRRRRGADDLSKPSPTTGTTTMTSPSTTTTAATIKTVAAAAATQKPTPTMSIPDKRYGSLIVREGDPFGYAAALERRSTSISLS